jgi:hypothetical protein
MLRIGGKIKKLFPNKEENHKKNEKTNKNKRFLGSEIACSLHL